METSPLGYGLPVLASGGQGRGEGGVICEPTVRRPPRQLRRRLYRLLHPMPHLGQMYKKSTVICLSVLLPLIAFMANYRKRKPSASALNSGLWVRRLLMVGSPLLCAVPRLIG